jgi:hypothetical protein
MREPYVIAASLFLLAGLTPTLATAQSAVSGITRYPTQRIADGTAVAVIDAATAQAVAITRSSAIGYFQVDVPPGAYAIAARQGDASFIGIAYVGNNEIAACDAMLRHVETERLPTTPDATLTQERRDGRHNYDRMPRQSTSAPPACANP